MISANKHFLEKKNVHIGYRTYGIPKIIGQGQEDKLDIGKYCSIADEVALAFTVHHAKWLVTYPLSRLFNQPKKEDAYSKGALTIKNDVWIGYRAFIFSGITIENGAIIGAHSVVTKDIPPYAIVVGNPAQLIGYRFNKEQIDYFLKIKWWDWPEDKIKEFMDVLCSDNFDEFLLRAEHDI